MARKSIKCRKKSIKCVPIVANKLLTFYWFFCFFSLVVAHFSHLRSTRDCFYKVQKYRQTIDFATDPRLNRNPKRLNLQNDRAAIELVTFWMLRGNSDSDVNSISNSDSDVPIDQIRVPKTLQSDQSEIHNAFKFRLKFNLKVRFRCSYRNFDPDSDQIQIQSEIQIQICMYCFRLVLVLFSYCFCLVFLLLVLFLFCFLIVLRNL